MKLMEKKKGPTWANEAATPVPVPVSIAPAPAAEDAEAQGAMSDLEWMRQRMSVAVVDDVVEERVFEQDEEDGGEPAKATKPQAVCVGFYCFPVKF